MSMRNLRALQRCTAAGSLHGGTRQNYDPMELEKYMYPTKALRLRGQRMQGQGAKPVHCEKTSIQFLKLYFAGILVLLALATTVMVVRLYQTSRLLGESDRKAFVLEAQNKGAILGDYFRRRMSEVDAFCDLKVFQTYYEAKAAGMSVGQGLKVLSSPIEQELLIRRLDTEEQGRSVYASAAFFDLESGKILARNGLFSQGQMDQRIAVCVLSKKT